MKMIEGKKRENAYMICIPLFLYIDALLYMASFGSKTFI